MWTQIDYPAKGGSIKAQVLTRREWRFFVVVGGGV